MAGGIDAGRAVLSVEAELDKSSLDKVSRDAAGRLRDSRGRFVKEGQETGKAYGNAFAWNTQAMIQSQTAKIASSGTKIGDNFVKNVSRSFSKLGGLVAAPFSKTIGTFVSGFRSSEVAASAFSGRLGTLGGHARRSLQPIVDSTNRFVRGFQDSTFAAASYSGALGTLGGVARRVLQPAISTVRGIGSAFSRVGATVGRVVAPAFGAIGRAASSAGGIAQRALGGLRRVAGTVAGGLGSIASSASNAFGAIIRGADQAASRMVSFGKEMTIATAPIQALVGDALFGGAKRLMTLENARSLLNTIGAETEKVMASVDRAVTGTRFALNEAADMGALLAAAGFDAGKETERWLSATADIAQASGRSFGEISYTMTEVAQSGRAMGGELRQLPLAVSALADELGVSQDEVRRLASEGEITSDVWIRAIEKAYGGISKGAGTTFQSALANIRTAMARLGAGFLEPIFGVLRDAMLEAIPVIDKFGDNAAAAGQVVASGISWMIEAFKALPSPIQKAVGILAGFLAAIGPISIVAGTLLPVLANIGKVFMFLLKPIGLLISVVKVLWVNLKMLAVAFTWISAPILVAIAAIAAIGVALVLLYKKNETFRNAVQAAWEWVKNAVVQAWEGYIKPALAAFANFVTGTLWPAIQAFWNNGVKPVFQALGSFIAAVWTGVIWPALKAFGAFLVGPLWSGVKTVFGGIISAFQTVGKAVSDVWKIYIQPPLMEWIGFFRSVFGPVFSWLYTSVIQPVFNGIVAAVQFAWANIMPALTAVWTFISTILSPALNTLGVIFRTVFTVVGTIVSAAWAIIQPIFNAISTVIRSVVIPSIQFFGSILLSSFGLITAAIKLWWNGVAKPIFTLFMMLIRTVVVPVIQFLWNIFRTVFNAIMTVIRTWWNVVVRPIFNAVVAFIRNVLGPIFRWLWNSIVSPVFGWIGSKISGVWNGTIRPAFDGIRAGARKVGEAFGAAKDAVSRAWDKLKSIVSKPIRAAVSFVNEKLIGNLNKIPGVKIKKIPKFATGGPVRGPGTGTSDSILARLSKGEHVLTAQDVKLMGGHGRVEAMRAAAKAGQFQIPGYAKGGRVWPTSTKATGRGYPGHTGIDFPAPMGAPVYAAAPGMIMSTPRLGVSYGHHINQMAGPYHLIYAHLSSIMAKAGQIVKGGEVIGRVGSTGNSTGPHLHFEVRPPGTQSGSLSWLHGANFKGSAGMMGNFMQDEPEISAMDWLKDKFGINKIIDAIKGWFKGKAGVFSSSDMFGLMNDTINKVWQKIKDTVGNIKDVASNMAKSVGGKIKGLFGFDSGGIARGTGMMPKNTIKPERVLSPRETVAFEKMREEGFQPRISGEVSLDRRSIEELAVMIAENILRGSAMVANDLDNRREFISNRDSLLGGLL